MMKAKMKRLMALVFAVVIVASGFVMASAAPVETVTVTYLEDGSYIVKTISEVQQVSIFAVSATRTKSGTATQEYYNSSDELMWELSVHGTFTYDGSSAEATDADCSYDVYSSSWSCRSASASCSGATARATGTFRHLGVFSETATVTLTCSPSGTLS